MMMMSFCKKSVHSFLGLSNFPLNNKDNGVQYSPPCKFSNGLGLIAASPNKTPNILESSSVKPSAFPTSSCLPPPPRKTDPGCIGFLDDIGGSISGLMSCTESLGFESYDGRRVGNDEFELSETSSSLSNKIKWRKAGEKREVKKFPPPLPSLNRNGQPSFFLRPVRKNGRLELTEVRNDRPEILRASREDGRLRLHIIRGKEEAERVNEEEWEKFPVTGERFRRCHQLVSLHDYHRGRRRHHHHHQHHSNHHHNFQAWSQRCVTIT